ncbi:MAG TPA: hypothetical protein VK196_00375 [Magnetospirillum sp.]|nr:hypothetical protein [Magnetospirillum sp.]
MDAAQATRVLLLFFVVPLWLLAGIADWLCHRRSDIAHTSGAKESLIHLLMLAEMGIPVLAALILEINALVLTVMLVAFFLHEATALWDVSYATAHRRVTPVEQHVHSFLEVLPLMGLAFVASLNWPQALSMAGLGPEPADWGLRLKGDPLPAGYLASVLGAVVGLELLPYVEEFLRGWRARHARPPCALRD